MKRITKSPASSSNKRRREKEEEEEEVGCSHAEYEDGGTSSKDHCLPLRELMKSFDFVMICSS